ncbi:hypothetical protein [Rickettsia endosymbiont of Orchestes rusci]
MIKSRHDTAFFQRSYNSGSSHGMTAKILKRFLCIYLNLLQKKTISTASG